MSRIVNLMQTITSRAVRVRKGVFFEADIGEDVIVENMSLPQFTFKSIGLHLLGNDDIFVQRNKAKKFCDRFNQGHICYGFFNNDGAIAAYIWVSIPVNETISTPCLFRAMKLILEPGSAYIWDCFTAPAYRQRSLYKYGLLNAKSVCFTMGVKKAYIYCAKDNVASRNGILSAGFWESFQFSAIRIGPICIYKKVNGAVRIMRTRQAYDIIGF